MGIDNSRSRFNPGIPQTWPPLLTIDQTAQILNLSPWTLRQWDNKGRLVSVRIGARRDRRYNKEEILKVLEKGI